MSPSGHLVVMMRIIFGRSGRRAWNTRRYLILASTTSAILPPTTPYYNRLDGHKMPRNFFYC